MWIFDLGTDDGIAKYAVLKDGSKNLAEEWAIKFANAQGVYFSPDDRVEIPDQENKLFIFEGQRYEMINGFDLADFNEFSTYFTRFSLNEDDSLYKNYCKVKKEHPNCFKEEVITHNSWFFGKTIEHKVEMLGFPLEPTDVIRKYVISNYRLRIID